MVCAGYRLQGSIHLRTNHKLPAYGTRNVQTEPKTAVRSSLLYWRLLEVWNLHRALPCSKLLVKPLPLSVI